MRIAIFANVTEDQLAYLRRLAMEYHTDAIIVVEGEAVTPASRTTRTLLTGVHFDAAARAGGMTAVQVASQAARFGIATVEEALQHPDIPANVKSALEATL